VYGIPGNQELKVAFGLRRWLIAALACSALVAVVFLPPDWERYELRYYFYYRSREERLANLLWASRSRLGQLELRDSLLASAAEYRRVREPIVLVQDGLPRALADTLRALAEKPFSAVRQGKAEHRTVLAVSAHDARVMWSGPRTLSGINFYLPVATDGETCLAAIALRPEASEAEWLRNLKSAAKSFALLGPCAYNAAFGKPGSHIREWLESSDYQPAMWPAWTVDAEPLGPLAPEERQWVRRDRGGLVVCAAGNRYSCSAGALTLERLEGFLRLYPTYRREPGILGAPMSWRYLSVMGPNVERLLSDLLVDMGEERFARFWTSEAPVETAFADAFDVELEDWMMQWARIQVGDVERPVADPSSAVLGLLLAAAFVGGATFLARSRQVS
jgi:hypothetical protein